MEEYPWESLSVCGRMCAATAAAARFCHEVNSVCRGCFHQPARASLPDCLGCLSSCVRETGLHPSADPDLLFGQKVAGGERLGRLAIGRYIDDLRAAPVGMLVLDLQARLPPRRIRFGDFSRFSRSLMIAVTSRYSGLDLLAFQGGESAQLQVEDARMPASPSA